MPKRFILVLAAMTLSGATQPPLTGEWGGDRARLTLSPTGGTIEQDCGSGTIKGPLRLDARQRFKASGTFEAFAPGMALADVPASQKQAHYQGTVKGDAMTLSIQIKGAAEPTTIHLVRGKRIKIIRCL